MVIFIEGMGLGIMEDKFIVGRDAKDNDIFESCNTNDNHCYMKNVYFKPEVLEKYYTLNSKYIIDEYWLDPRLASWMLAYINHCDFRHIIVKLGDLNNLPQEERKHWQNFNYYSNENYNEKYNNPVSNFKMRYKYVNGLFEKYLGWQLFMDLADDDRYCFESIRIPYENEQNLFDTQIGYMTKVLIDSLNEKQLKVVLNKKSITIGENDGGIKKLEALCNVYIPFSQHIEFLKKLQKLRSQLFAHRKTRDVSKIEKVYTDMGINKKDLRLGIKTVIDKSIDFFDFMISIYGILRAEETNAIEEVQ